MELEEDYKKDHSRETGTETAYAVEARYAYPSPVSVAGQIFDNRWRRVHFKDSEIGVPAAPAYSKHIVESGLLAYTAAQALRWWLHAAAETQPLGSLCLETRLIKHKIEYSRTVTAVSQHAIIGGNDRSNCAPDWGRTAVQSP